MGSNDTTVSVGVIAGAIVTFIIGVLSTYWPELPVLDSTTAAAAVTILSGLAQWFLPHSAE